LKKLGILLKVISLSLSQYKKIVKQIIQKEREQYKRKIEILKRKKSGLHETLAKDY